MRHRFRPAVEALGRRVVPTIIAAEIAGVGSGVPLVQVAADPDEVYVVTGHHVLAAITLPATVPGTPHAILGGKTFEFAGSDNVLVNPNYQPHVGDWDALGPYTKTYGPYTSGQGVKVQSYPLIVGPDETDIVLTCTAVVYALGMFGTYEATLRDTITLRVEGPEVREFLVQGDALAFGLVDAAGAPTFGAAGADSVGFYQISASGTAEGYTDIYAEVENDTHYALGLQYLQVLDTVALTAHYNNGGSYAWTSPNDPAIGTDDLIDLADGAASLAYSGRRWFVVPGGTVAMPEPFLHDSDHDPLAAPNAPVADQPRYSAKPAKNADPASGTLLGGFLDHLGFGYEYRTMLALASIAPAGATLSYATHPHSHGEQGTIVGAQAGVSPVAFGVASWKLAGSADWEWPDPATSPADVRDLSRWNAEMIAGAAGSAANAPFSVPGAGVRLAPLWANNRSDIPTDPYRWRLEGALAQTAGRREKPESPRFDPPGGPLATLDHALEALYGPRRGRKARIA